VPVSPTEGEDLTANEKADAILVQVGCGVDALRLPRGDWEFSRMLEDGKRAYVVAHSEFLAEESVEDISDVLRHMLVVDASQS